MPTGSSKKITPWGCEIFSVEVWKLHFIWSSYVRDRLYRHMWFIEGPLNQPTFLLITCCICNSQLSPSCLFVSPDWVQNIYYFCMMTTATVQQSSHTPLLNTFSTAQALALACIIYIHNFPSQVNWINIKDNFCFNISPKSVWNRTNLKIRIPDVSWHCSNMNFA